MISLKNLHEATAQQVFDQVVGHLRSQGQKSQTVLKLGAVPSCVYRNQQGLKCAAGCLIADDEYRETFEGSTWSGVLDEIVGDFSYSPVRTHSGLISRLQQIHDSGDVCSWENAFLNTANEFGLVVPLQ